jgi:2-methylisocitrate lyase-like PEP mutase family enzyme
VATASVATAITNGYEDGERIPFSRLLEIVNQITSAVNLPVTVDIERGFADSVPVLKDNIRQLIEHGAVGLNIEDSWPDHNGLNSIPEQCRKIEAIRETGMELGVPIVINARTDLFLLKQENAVSLAIERARAFQSAGADCVYPILIGNYEDIARLIDAVDIPVNVNLQKSIADLRRLEKMGVARVSIGPQLLYHVVSTMKKVAESLQQYDTTYFFSQELVTRDYLNALGSGKF